MSNVDTWSATASSNNSAAPNGFPENMNYSDVNNSAREVMAAIAKWRSDMNGTLDTTGSASAYLLTSNRVISAYADGMEFVFKANHTNTGATTIDVDGVGAVAITWADGTALAANDILSGDYYRIYHDGTDFTLDPILGKSIPAGALVGTTDTQTLSNKTMTDTTFSGSIAETVYALSGATPAIDASNGSVQTWTLTGNSTPTDSLSAGEAIELWIDDGSAYSITWTMVDEWEGGAAPALATSGYTVVVLRKISTTVYGAIIGSFS